MVSPCSSSWPEFCHVTYVVLYTEHILLKIPKLGSQTQNILNGLRNNALNTYFSDIFVYQCFAYRYICAPHMCLLPIYIYKMIISDTLDLESHKEKTHGNLYQRFFQKKATRNQNEFGKRTNGRGRVISLVGSHLYHLKNYMWLKFKKNPLLSFQ